MTETYYIYERGACRGYEFTHRNSIAASKLVELVEKGITLHRSDNDDELETLLDGIGDELGYEVTTAVYGLIKGGDFVTFQEAEKAADKWLEALKKGEPVFIELEESDIAFATSTKEALITSALNGENDEGW